MAQLPHLSISGTDPVDITAILPAGRYIAQVEGEAPYIGVRYATGTTAPAALADYFRAGGGESFRFESGCADRRCWVVTYGVPSADIVRLSVAKV